MMRIPLLGIKRKATLLGEQSTFSPLSRLPYEWFSWHYALCTPCTCVTNRVKLLCYPAVMKGTLFRGRSNFFICILAALRGIFLELHTTRGPGSVVGIATGYGLDGPGIESRWGEIFRTCPDQPWGPPSLLYNGYRVFLWGNERPEMLIKRSTWLCLGIGMQGGVTVWRLIILPLKGWKSSNIWERR